ncbi:chromosome segregation protein SMC [Thiohalorhabdus sp.]|uniref:chromosome segregation protein SMC n=1 Tax=Thiohalorhabdus sp. TaxID=3094134 RepID=UPI002FC376EF
MKLRRIKLSGFKSFVEPTTIPLPSDITAVVGPNGCGKSNVVDAVRWVLGEGSAKHLRGGHMSDFVFNGSDNRAPVSRAVAELVFDNSEGVLGGPYAAYDEISVKRAVDRDGGSEYYLNGSRCRRKDITDLFLGTGLGPRAYAIIEQGTIGRIVEARPEDRRLMVEEAAGVTRYKERRKETVRRIEQTRENLERVEDLRSELGDRLERLGEQAEWAREYKRLKQEQREVDQQLLGARYRDQRKAVEAQQGEVRRYETELEAARSQFTETEAEAERQRQALDQANEAVNEAQGRYYARESELAGLEREQAHARQEKQRLEEERDAAHGEIAELEQRLAEHQQRIDEAVGEQEDLRAEVARLEAAHQEAASALEQAREHLRAAEEADREAREAVQAPAQEAGLQDERRQQAESRLAALAERRGTLRAELAELAETTKDVDTESAQATLETAEERRDQAAGELEAAEAAFLDREGERDEATEAVTQRRHERERIMAQLESLRTLERRGEDLNTGTQALLERVEGDRSRLLGGRIRVASGWETAVEEVLADRLQALVVAGSEWPEELTWMRAQEAGRYPAVRPGNGQAGDAAGGGLLGKVECDSNLRPVIAEWLVGVGVADDLDHALARAGELGPGAVLVTPEGDRVGRDWVVVHRGDADPETSWLRRQREIERLEERLAAEEEKVTRAEEALEAARTAFDTARERVDAARGDLSRSEEAVRQAREELNRRQGEANRAEERRQHLEAELERLADEEATETAAKEEAAEAVEAARQRESAGQAESEARQRELEDARTAAQSAESAEREAREALNQAKSRLDSLEAARQETERHTQWANDELAKRRQRLDELQERLAEQGEPASGIQERLDAAMAARAEAEAELNERRKAAEAAQSALSQTEGRRAEAETEVEARRSALEEARQDLNKAEVRLEEVEGRIQEAGTTPQAVLAGLSDDADAAALEKRRGELQKAIDQLGTVNLAAIEEHDEVSERKSHLDDQAADLEEALNTLENAIHRIDAETRKRFRETFEAVDANFRRLFPRLFGGGRAYLAMTDTQSSRSGKESGAREAATEADPMETGVDIMAQPPGKKVSSINLLSGGEKALTAVAMTFALFQLNPAPFCVLDEVDAPLDDANVGRYGELLQEMSETTQFIVVTHNKTTMQVAEQLVGVTMAEPGVSRMVAVSVEEGAELVEAG